MQGSELSALDRGFNYGDGFFTTMLVKKSEVELWDYHQQRLLNAQRVLKFPEIDLESLLEQVKLKVAGRQICVAKVVVSRGQGGRGYAPPKVVTPTILISTADYPKAYNDLQKNGLRVGSATQRLSYGGLYSSVKTLNRLEQVMLKIEAEERGFDDLVCLDINDHVVEGVASNLFWVKGNYIYTSDLGGAGVAGVQRQFLLNSIQHSPYQLKLGTFSLSDLLGADEIFMSNSIIQFAPVKQFDERKFNQFPVCRWFQDLVNNVS
ncbi:aminodeoxychorismate lyase [Agarivorans sp. DSG3-1]|uniref:aminodeoxychorismate lyase n=1 Tax=Agarivorans sp. DSG3-1 TaxID=3342249 RepID=UPI00398EF80C